MCGRHCGIQINTVSLDIANLVDNLSNMKFVAHNVVALCVAVLVISYKALRLIVQKVFQQRR